MKQGELKLTIKGTSQAERIKKGIPTTKELIESKRMKPKNLEHCSTKMINDLLKVYAGRF